MGPKGDRDFVRTTDGPCPSVNHQSATLSGCPASQFGEHLRIFADDSVKYLCLGLSDLWIVFSPRGHTTCGPRLFGEDVDAQLNTVVTDSTIPMRNSGETEYFARASSAEGTCSGHREGHLSWQA